MAFQSVGAFDILYLIAAIGIIIAVSLLKKITRTLRLVLTIAGFALLAHSLYSSGFAGFALSRFLDIGAKATYLLEGAFNYLVTRGGGR